MQFLRRRRGDLTMVPDADHWSNEDGEPDEDWLVVPAGTGAWVMARSEAVSRQPRNGRERVADGRLWSWAQKLAFQRGLHSW